jgi:colanic acid/amylovoran biosynthesis glycosyltransferase
MRTVPAPTARVVYFVSLFPCWSETFIVREILELLGLGVDVRIVSLKRHCEPMVQSDAQSLLDRVIYPRPGVRGAIRALGEVLRRPHRAAVDLAQIAGGLLRHPASLIKSLVVWWRTLGLLADLRPLRPTHLHAHWATYPSTAALIASRRMGVRFSFTAHAHDIFVEDHLLAAKMKQAAFCVTISRFNQRFLAAAVSSEASNRTRVIHCGVSPANYAFAPDGRQQGLIVAVGRLDEVKGFSHLIDACCLLRRSRVPFDCVVIGDGPQRSTLERQIASHGLADCVRLLGACPQEEVRRYLSIASVFALPSVVAACGNRDGIPVALMEAMACGVPVVSTRVSGIPELVEHESEGLLAEPADAVDLARCIERQLTEPEAARAMAARARYKIESEFNVVTESRKLYAAIV